MRLLAATLVALALLAPACSAQSGTLLSVLASGDADLNRPIVALSNAQVAYIDANGNAQADADAPDEPVYLDLDGSNTVTYGDLRLSPFGAYPAGSSVGVTNGDVGRPLVRASGWFASAGSDWFVDMDGSGSATVGDIRLAPSAFTKLHANDPSLGRSTPRSQQAVSSGSRLGFLDGDADGRFDVGEPVVIDVDAFNGDTAHRATPGDVRLRSSGAAVDDPVSRAEYEQGLRQAGVDVTDGQQPTSDSPRNDAAGSGWGTPEFILLLLCLAALACVVVVYRRDRRPRNPFK